MTTSRVPDSARVPWTRVRALNRAPVRPDGGYVLYWMVATRRARWNYALDRAVELALELRRPLIVLEALRVDYPFASDRHHRFLLDGMADNERAFRGTAVLYHPYVEPSPGAGKGLLAALAARACAVVTDDFPAFFLPRMLAAAARKLPVRLEAVDANGLLPLRAATRAFARAHDFRRFLQRELPPHLLEPPRRAPARSLGRARCGGSSRSDSTVTAGRAGTRTRRPRAACRPTCTSVTFRRTRCSRRWPRARAGRRQTSAAPSGGSAAGGGACGRRSRPSSTSSSPGANSGSTPALTARITTATGRCRSGRDGRWPSMRTIRGRTCTRASGSNGRRRTMHSGTRRRTSCCRGPDPQLPAHALGQEDPALE